MRILPQLAFVVSTLTAAIPASGQLRPLCFEGAQYTCFGLQVVTTPTAGGTAVTVRLASLEGSTLSNVPTMTPWARVLGIELIGRAGAFAGGTVDSVDPGWMPTGTATVVGDTRKRWLSYNIADDTAGYQGFALITPFDSGGADIVGCTVPPNEDYPYFTTCNRSGPAAVEFTFSTNGNWQASDAAVVISISDPDGDRQTCMVAGATYDSANVYHCFDPNASTTPATTAVSIVIQPARVSLSSTPIVSVILLSQTGFDPSAVDPSSVRLRVSTGPDVTPAARGTSIITAVHDYNGDGYPDRMIGFTVAALKAAGFATTTTSLTLHPATGSAWSASLATPPDIVP